MRLVATRLLSGGRRSGRQRRAPQPAFGMRQPGLGQLWPGAHRDRLRRPGARIAGAAILLVALLGCASTGSQAPPGPQPGGATAAVQTTQPTAGVQEGPTPTAGPVRYNLTLQAQASASSEHAPEEVPDRGLVQYTADRSTDRSPSSAWIEGVAGPGIDEQLTLTFPQPVVITELGLIVGLDRDEDIFLANNRLRQAQLAFSDGSTLEVEFEDRRGLQYVKLDNVTTSSLSIKILAVYAGSRYDDTAIAEVEVWGYNTP